MAMMGEFPPQGMNGTGMPPGMPPEAPQMPMGGDPMAGISGGMGEQAPPQQPPQPPPEMEEWSEALMPQVEALLKNDKLRSFRIDIETDSTIQPDEDEDKQRRTEFVTTIGGFMNQVMPLAQQFPYLGPVAAETLLYLARGYRAGRTLEDAIERAMAQMAQAAQQPPPPDPRIEAEKAKLEMLQQKHAADLEAKQMDVGIKQQANEMQLEGMRAKTGLEVQKGSIDLQMKQAEMGMKQQQFQQEAQQSQAEMAMRQREAEMGMNMRQKEAEMEHQHARMHNEMQMRHTNQKAMLDQQAARNKQWGPQR